MIAALVGLALAPIAAGAEEQHHQPEAATPSSPPAATPSTPMMMPMMNMMNMMNMMGRQPGGMPMTEMMGQGGGMGMMGMGQGSMPMMMGMGEHLEGRIAFLRAELAITEAQAPAWDRFAQALRDGAARAKHMPASMQQTTNGSADTLQRLEQEEQRLSARLEAVKATRAAFAGLQAVLSDEQKSKAEGLFTRPVCLGAMGAL
jgi:hypothetical protein